MLHGGTGSHGKAGPQAADGDTLQVQTELLATVIYLFILELFINFFNIPNYTVSNDRLLNNEQ
jgi:hypothetical protein